MPVEGTITVVTQSNEFMSTGDIIAIVVAVISLLGVIISTFWTNETTKEISESNEKLQEKWNQKNIDASLTASARIDWIQNVRNATADLIRYYYDILNTTDPSEVAKALIDSQQKTELLTLYFGPEDCDCDTTYRNKDHLLNTNDNTGKNDIMVGFIADLANRFAKYSVDVKNNRLQRLEEAAYQARVEAYNNASEEFAGFYCTDDGDEIPCYDKKWTEEDESNVYQAEDALRNAKKEIQQLREDLVFLRNAMRIYLKIEWNKAKAGQ